MNKFNVTILALVFAMLGGCANMAGTMVGTSATSDTGFPYVQEAIPQQTWTNDD